MKIVHIITGLQDGGAEHTLYKICKYDSNNHHIVISFRGNDKYLPLLNNIGIKVYCLNVGFFSIHKFFILIRLIRFLKPDVVQTWLLHADLIGGIAARLAGIRNILWNIRYSNIEGGKSKLSTILIIKILSKLSYKIPKLILVVSKKAKKIYENKGYDKRKLKFIPNGYDFSILKVKKSEKKNFRKNLRIQYNTPLLGKVARYDPLKDHSNLLKALSLLQLKKKNFFCVLVGTNINKNKELSRDIKKLKLSGYVKLLGPTKNISKVMNGLDINIQSSNAEGFPNVVAEAMSLETPCVATDVGDTSYIVGKTGWIVPPNNPLRLSKAIEKAILEMDSVNWKKRCVNARLRIKKKFDIYKMIELYNKLWLQL